MNVTEDARGLVWTHLIIIIKMLHTKFSSHIHHCTYSGNTNFIGDCQLTDFIKKQASKTKLFYQLTMRSLLGDKIPKREETFRPIPESTPCPWGRTCWWIFPILSGIRRISWPPDEDKIKLPPCEQMWN